MDSAYVPRKRKYSKEDKINESVLYFFPRSTLSFNITKGKKDTSFVSTVFSQVRTERTMLVSSGFLVTYLQIYELPTYVFSLFSLRNSSHGLRSGLSTAPTHPSARTQCALALALYLSLTSFVYFAVRNRSAAIQPIHQCSARSVYVVCFDCKNCPSVRHFTRIFTFMTRRALSGVESSQSFSAPLFVLKRTRSGNVRGSLGSRSDTEGAKPSGCGRGRYLIHNKLNSSF